MLVPTGYERRLSPSVQLTVRSRRRALAGRARGRVLDLGGAGSHVPLWSSLGVEDVCVLGPSLDRELDDLVGTGDCFDTVLSVFRLVAVADLDRTVAQLKTLLADDGRLLFLEPRGGGPAAGTARALRPGFPGAVVGYPGRDVPSTLRRAGLSVTDLERHRIPTLPWWRRHLVEGAAHHALAPGRPAPGA